MHAYMHMPKSVSGLGGEKDDLLLLQETAHTSHT